MLHVDPSLVWIQRIILKCLLAGLAVLALLVHASIQGGHLKLMTPSGVATEFGHQSTSYWHHQSQVHAFSWDLWDGWYKLWKRKDKHIFHINHGYGEPTKDVGMEYDVFVVLFPSYLYQPSLHHTSFRRYIRGCLWPSSAFCHQHGQMRPSHPGLLVMAQKEGIVYWYVSAEQSTRAWPGFCGGEGGRRGTFPSKDHSFIFIHAKINAHAQNGQSTRKTIVCILCSKV